MHVIPVSFHGLDEFELVAGPVQVVVGVHGFEVVVSLEVVGEKAHAALSIMN